MIKLIIDVYVRDIEEDIFCIDYNEENNIIAFGGNLGVVYIYSLGQKLEKEVLDVDMMEIDSKKTDPVLVRLNGHFKTVT